MSIVSRGIRKALWLTALVCLLGAAALCVAETAEPELSVSLPEIVKGYTPCTIRIVSSEDGEAELRLYDVLENLWLTRRELIFAGENRITWDGLGENMERLFAGPYRLRVTLNTKSDAQVTETAKFEINGTIPTLVYALPSSHTLYLDGSERWFTEIYVSYECIVAMEIRDGKGDRVYLNEVTASDPDGEPVFWNGTLNAYKKIEPGEYTATFRSKMNPSYESSFHLTVAQSNPLSREIRETGPVIPERGMSDGEIWEIMMKPSVVISASARQDFNLYELPRSGSKVVGTLSSATQALEVLRVEGDWSQVVAWSHVDGSRQEGYILTSRLTVVMPNTPYGVLVDKRDQTLTVFENGERIGTIPVSTGLVVGRDTYRETAAGAFLTDIRLGSSFAQEGYRYEYPIRYDNKNIIHGVGYTRQGRVRDYSNNLPKLGQKASHGCVRVSPFIAEDSPLNMYWLWLHLPYHTRVIILDD